MSAPDDDFLIDPHELKAVGFCFKGQRTWLMQRNMDVRDHFDNGTLASVLIESGDGFAQRAVELVKGRRNGRR